MRWDPAKQAMLDDLVRRKRLSLLRVAARDLVGLDDLEQVTGSLTRRRPCSRRRHPSAARPPAPAAAVAAAPAAPASPSSPWASTAPRSSTTRATSTWCSCPRHRRGGRRLPRPSVVAIARRRSASTPTCARRAATARSSGPLDSYVAYWERWARPWEFQALLKARWSAGDRRDRRRRFEQAAAERLWARRFGADDLGELRAMKARAEGDRRQPGPRPSASSSAAAAASATSSSPSSCCSWCTAGRPGAAAAGDVGALAELAGAGYVGGGGRGGAGDRVPVPAHRRAPPAARRGGAGPHRPRRRESRRDRLARVLGFADSGRTAGGDRFDERPGPPQATGRAIHERLFFRPAARGLRRRRRLATGTACPRTARRGAAGRLRLPRRRADPQALDELTRGLTRILAADAAAAAAPARLAVGVARPRSGPRSACGRSPAERTAVTARHGLPGVARARAPALPAARDEPAPRRDHRPPPGLRHPSSTTSRRSPRRRPGELAEERCIAAASRPARPAGRGRAAPLLRNRDGAHRRPRPPRPRRGCATTGRGPRRSRRRRRSRPQLAVRRAWRADGRGRHGQLRRGARSPTAATSTCCSCTTGRPPRTWGRRSRRRRRFLRSATGRPLPSASSESTPRCVPKASRGRSPAASTAYAKYHRRWGETWERQALLRARPVAGDESRRRARSWRSSTRRSGRRPLDEPTSGRSGG